MNRITVHVKPGSKQAGILRLDDDEFEIRVIERPEKGRATEAARKALAEALHIPKTRLSLVMGASSKTKVFEII